MLGFCLLVWVFLKFSLKKRKALRFAALGARWPILLEQAHMHLKAGVQNRFKVPDTKLRSVLHALCLKLLAKTTLRQDNLQHVLCKVLLSF